MVRVQLSLSIVGFGLIKIRIHVPIIICCTDKRSQNEPHRRTLRQAAQIWLDLDRDPSVSVIVLTGKGKGFCAGVSQSLKLLHKCNHFITLLSMLLSFLLSVSTP